jgi:hypothetical protein
MDFTLLEEAFLDPRTKQNQFIEKQNQVQDVLKDSVLPEEQTVVTEKEYIYDTSHICCNKCKRINWFNVIVILLLMYIIFKK